MHRAIVLLFAGVCFAAAQPSEEAAKKELKLFAGKWSAAYATTLDGDVLPDSALAEMELVFDGDKFKMKQGGANIEGRVKLDPTKKPKTIDIFIGDGDTPLILGIYEVSTDGRKSCFAKPKNDRPKEFRKDKDFLYLEWTRAK